MHRLLALLVVLLIAPAMTGCGSSVSSKDMGTILYKIPHVQGADKLYELPKIITPMLKPTSPIPRTEKALKPAKGKARKKGNANKQSRTIQRPPGRLRPAIALDIGHIYKTDGKQIVGINHPLKVWLNLTFFTIAPIGKFLQNNKIGYIRNIP